MLALIPDVSVQLGLAHTHSRSGRLCAHGPAFSGEPTPSQKPGLKGGKESLPYKLVVASSRKQGGTKPEPASPAYNIPNRLSIDAKPSS